MKNALSYSSAEKEYVRLLQETLDWCLTELEERGLPDIPGTVVKVFHNEKRTALLASIRKETLEDRGFVREEKTPHVAVAGVRSQP